MCGLGGVGRSMTGSESVVDGRSPRLHHVEPGVARSGRPSSVGVSRRYRRVDAPIGARGGVWRFVVRAGRLLTGREAAHTIGRGPARRPVMSASVQPSAAPPSSGPPDAELMLAFRGGDARAFEALVQRHQRGIYNFILRSVRDRGRAEELLQEVFLRVVRAKDRYERTAKFTTWVYAIARNLCVDESRRARFRDHQSLDTQRQGKDGDAGPNLLSRMPAPQVPTDEAAEAPTLRKRMKAAIEALPDEQREVFLLR